MEDTIAAIATPFGEGGIGIIRLSGDEAGRILSEVFVPAGKAGTDETGSRKLMMSTRSTRLQTNR